MKQKAKILGVTLAALLGIAALTGCSSNDSGKKDNGDGKAKFTIMANLHTPEVPSEKIQKLIEEKTNTELTIQWTPDGNYEEKLSTAFSTQTLPEVVFLKNITTFLQFKEAIRDDQFWEIEPYFDEFPNLKNLNPQILDNTRVEGKLYSLYRGTPLARQGLIYRKDWAENLGLKEPTNIDEFYEMARAFTEDDPDGNGKKDTFGLTDRSDLVYGAFKTVSSWFGTPNNWGEKDGQLLPEFMFDEYIETMDFFKDLRDKGYINQDFPVTSKDDQQAFFKNGTAGMYVGSMSDVESIHRDAVDINPDVEYDVVNKIEGPNGEFGIWAVPGYGTVVLFPKSAIKDEEQLKGILAFFDKMASPEVANLSFWGIEGEHYELKDGKALASDNAEIIDREVKPYQSLTIGEPATTGRYEVLSDYEIKMKAEDLIVENEDYIIADPTVVLDSKTNIERGEILQQQIDDATYQYILGKIDLKGFEKAIDSWKKGGGDQIIEEFNQSWQEIK